ncbi:ArnT family glycosyltransferase [Novosphingobium aquiterrae]|uniref:ArnT family glycosyltransferase n=1 Tax=Novosphingobium aquiterrae TaxID=624388 RepID=A0ABV6PLX2_9SPHN
MNAKASPNALTAALILALAVLATQFLSVGREVIDPDESTFILMGADVAKGHLPFVEQFDLKPPMIFLAIGAVLAVFGKSIVAVRLLGDAMLLGTAVLVFLFARRLTSAWSALAGALLYVAFASLDLGQPTYSELPALLFGMAALAVLAHSPVTMQRAALGGLLLSLAVLSRTNLYPLPLVFGALLLFAAMRKRSTADPRAWLAFGLGGLVPVALLIAVYALAGHLDLLKLAMIDVPLAYSQQVGVLAAVRENVTQFYVITTMEPLIVVPFVLMALLGLALAAARLTFPAQRQESWRLTVLLLALAALLVSLALSGAVYPHYWLQVLPVLAVFCAIGIGFVAQLRLGLIAALALTLLPLGAALGERLPQSLAVARNPEASADRFEVAAAARHIAASGVRHPSVWPWRNQLIDWYLDAPQLSKVGVQPENIARPPIASPLAAHGYIGRDEVGRLLVLKPDFVVTDAKGKGIEWLRATGQPVDAWLADNYRRDAQFGDVVVYRRINRP